MPNKRYNLLSIILILLLLAGTAVRFASAPGQPAVDPFLNKVRALFPLSSDIIDETSPFAHTKIFAYHPVHGRQELAGLAFRTSVLSPEIKGYGGVFDILVGLRADGTIAGAYFLDHNETPTYIGSLDTFLQQFSGKNIQKPLTLEKEIDGISGATITSEAVTRAIAQSGALAAEHLLTIKTAQPSAANPSGSHWEILAPLVLFAIAAAGILTHNVRLRWLALISGLIYFGIRHATMISVVQLANLALGQLPDFSQSPLLFTLLGLAFLGCLGLGMTFCGSLCPFAAAQELLDKLARKLKIPQLCPGKEINAKARYLKYLILFIALAISFWHGNTRAVGIEPFLTLFTGNGSAWAWSLVALMLTAALFNFRFWCKFFCPVGAFFGLLARFSFYKVRLIDVCGSCRSCVAACPTDAIQLDEQGQPIIDYPECIVCGACVRSCSKQGLKVKGHDRKTK